MEGPGSHGGPQGRRLPALTSHGHLLGGRVSYTQPADGFRSGIEPVLLAAAVPAKPGERILEAGAGAGAGLLCLAARIPGVQGLGVERDPVLVALAECNANASSQPNLRFIAADMTALPDLGTFDHAMANPPYHASVGTTSPIAAREAAKRRHPELAAQWTAALVRHLRPRGTLTYIMTSAMVPSALGAFAAAGCAPVALLPLWPKSGRSAKLVLLHGAKGSRSPLRVLSGMVLHAPDGSFTPQAEAILRHGEQLTF